MKVELNEESIKHINRLLQSLPISTYEIVKEITEEINNKSEEDSKRGQARQERRREKGEGEK